FQAEDGIRDRNVTGVQTCALPIFAVRCSHRELFGTRVPFRLQLALDLAGTVIRGGVGVGAGSVRSIAVSACVVVAIGVCFGLRRSEERRVGKERRTSGATGQSSSR